MVNELEYLRKCIRCGKTAKTKEDLNQFAVAIKNKYSRRNICKKCYAKEANEYRLRRWENQGLCRSCGKKSDRIGKPYCSTCVDRLNKLTQLRHWTLRLQAIQKLGGKCVICGITDLRLLTINHKDGRNYRTTIDKGDAFYYRILNGKRARGDLEVRCYNHNILYEFEQGYRKVPTELQDQIYFSQLPMNAQRWITE